MPTLYVTEPGATVRRTGGSLIVTVTEKIADSGQNGASQKKTRRRCLVEVEPHRLEMICLVGRCACDSKRGSSLSQTGNCHCLDDAKSETCLGGWSRNCHGQLDLRLLQFRLIETSEESIALGSRFCRRKNRERRWRDFRSSVESTGAPRVWQGYR